MTSVSPRTAGDGTSRRAAAPIKNTRWACCTTTSNNHQNTNREARPDLDANITDTNVAEYVAKLT